MKKDIEWLKNRLKQTIKFDAINDKEIGFKIAMDEVLSLINKLDDPEVLSQELPVIPQFVADFIEVRKGTDAFRLKYILCVAVERDEHQDYTKEYDWIADNDELFARAWLDGYEVEEEQKYYVLNKGNILLLSNSSNDIKETYYALSWVTDEVRENYQLTEQEIKDYDPRYWAFRKPVEELEE